ncbi:hypothetical protein N0V93_003142 [Gnomoniopsis smithogilvyi]|uniref:Uncharacterized protein n=1 Tax=Gnomoniopsis smithogilvyi TaxID=1191159 RepID=A0A9W9CYB8_9PEZI|nr:hypothetical protein N0V93_003142 [Gnomoniopsis smithogilvyi]
MPITLSVRLPFRALFQAKALLGLSTTKRHFSNSTTKLHLPYTEHIKVPCASSGHVIVSLHDTARHPVLSPLIINLPAFPVQDIADVDSYLPRFLQRYPSATIHYRWPRRDRRLGASTSNHESDQGVQDASDLSPLHWPTPIHDTLAGFDFLTRSLAPPPTGTNGHSRLQRRDVYIYGSFLGAGLAASLALTEAHANEPMAVRGLLTLNGVYNWTTFLPDHPLNTARLGLQKELGLDLAEWQRREDTDQDVGMLKALIPSLFQQPANLFDPFASPVLFFHTAGLMVPPSFTERWRPEYLSDKSSAASTSSSESDAIDPYDYVYSDPEDPPPPTPFPEAETDSNSDSETNSDSDSSAFPDHATTTTTMAPPPRKGYLAFPPRASSLRIPETLLLHSDPPPLPDIPDTVVGQRRRTAVWKKLKNAENSFASQAMGLAGLMRRSVNKLELKERIRWDEEFEDPEGEAIRRVETGVVGEEGSGQDVEAAERARQWLEERLG